jgi:hypothetical protein
MGEITHPYTSCTTQLFSLLLLSLLSCVLSILHRYNPEQDIVVVGQYEQDVGAEYGETI